LMNRGNALWQLGRTDEARGSLDRAAAMAAHPESGYVQLLAWVFLSQASLELSQLRLSRAESLSRKALDLAADSDRELAVRARCVRGLAQALSGSARAGNKLCAEAVELAGGLKNPRLLIDAFLSLSDATRLNGDPRTALSYALKAQEFYSHHEQQHSEWRSLLSAASAEMMLGDRASAREHASRAASLLSNMRQKFGESAYTMYISRPDVRDSSKRIESILSANQ
jgi:tetratricopeptide (TPR) repeat protein